MSANISWNSPDIVRDGLVLYLDASTSNSYNRYSSAGIWKDVNGNNTTGSLINGSTFNSDGGGSISFDGSDDYVTLGTPPLINGLVLPLTIHAWAKLNSTSGGRTIYSAYKSLSVGQLYSMIRVTNGTLAYFTSRGVAGGNWQGPSTTFTVPTGSWNFYGVVVSGTASSPNISVYFNSNFQTPTYLQLNTSVNLSVDFRIGGNEANPNTEGWNGNISSVQVYNRALSDAEVLQNYNATKGRFGL